MLRHLTALALIVVLTATIFFSLSRSAQAAGGSCSANPSSAPVGTTFQLSASGFTPNTPLFAYAVDPNGTAFSDPNFNAFGGSLKSNLSGNVSFSFASRFSVQDLAIARSFGTWQLVVQELGPGGTIANQATCSLTVTPNGADAPMGASLQAMPDTAPVGSEVIIYGSNFTPGELVNLWVSPPPGCASFGYGFPNILLQHATASAFSQDDVRADGAGQFAYIFPTDRTYACPGNWALSANAPVSKKGAIAFFKLTPQGVFEAGQPALVPQSTTVDARGGSLGFYGWHFLPNSLVSCWLGRPDLTVRFVDNYQTNSAGVFSFIYQTGFDDVAHAVHYSEGAMGTYTMSCRDNSYKTEADATFKLTGETANSSTSNSSTASQPVAPNPSMGPGMEP